jgi:hypothetical protein
VWDTDVAPVPVVTLAPESIIAQVRERTDRAFENSTEDRKEWDLNYDAYANIYDLGKRLPWQSQVTIPLVSRSVLHKAARIKSAMVSGTEDYYKIKAQTPAGEVAVAVHADLLRANLEAEDFPGKCEVALVSGELTSGPAYAIYPDEAGPWKGYFRVKPLDMRRVAIDHTGRGRFVSVVEAIDYADLVRAAKERGWDVDAVTRLKGGAGGPLRPEIKAHIERTARITNMDADDQRRREVALTEYWGPLHDDDGNEVYSFAYVVLGDGRELLYYADKPYGDGKGSVMTSDLLPNVFGVYGKSDVEDARELASFNTRLLRALIDGAAYDVMRGYIVDTTRMAPESVDDLQSKGLYPGIILEQEGDVRNAPALAPLDVGALPMGLINLYQLARQEFESGIEVTDMSRGVTPGKGSRDVTATEYAGKQEAASQGIDTLTQAVEEKSMEPLLERAVYFQGQYADLNDPEAYRRATESTDAALETLFEKKYGNQIPPPPQGEPQDPMEAQMMQQAAQEREQMAVQLFQSVRPELMDALHEAMKEPFTVSVRGIRGVLAQGEQLQKMAGATDFAGKLGAMSMLDVPGLVSRAYHLSGVDPKDAILPDGEKRYEAEQQQQNDMRQAQMQMAAAGQKPPQPPKGGGPGQ